MDKNLSSILKNSILISDVIGEYITLSKRGKNFFGLCPFHEDTSPSLVVNNDKKIFKCFVCGNTGDLITFVMKKENISFPEVLINISKKYNIKSEEISKLENRNKITEEEREFYEINLQAAEIYHNFLFEKENKEAKDYLHVRGLSDSEIIKYQIGFAPRGFETLLNLMTNKTNIFGDNRDKKLVWEITKLLKTKLVFLNDKGDYQDFFYNRIIFPIRDEFKRIVAFSGRAINNKITPKYLNSISSNYFKKDSILYNMDNVWNTSLNKLMITEGFMDVILSSKYGIENIVGTMGTELSEKHILKIKSNNFKSIIISMDNDKAGINSNLKIGKKLLESNCNVMIVNPYDEKLKDLADLANHLDNSHNFIATINNYVSYIEYLINQTFKNPLLVDDKIEQINNIALLISKYSDISVKNQYAGLIASKTNLDKDNIVELINSYQNKLENNILNENNFQKKQIFSKNDNIKTIFNVNESNNVSKKLLNFQEKEINIILIMAINHEVAKLFIENLNDTIFLDRNNKYLPVLNIVRKLSSKLDGVYSFKDVIKEMNNNKLNSFFLSKEIYKYNGINTLFLKNHGINLIIFLIKEKIKLINERYSQDITKASNNSETIKILKEDHFKIKNDYKIIIDRLNKMIKKI